MDPTPEEMTALADQLCQLAKSAAASTDAKEKKHQTQALVLQAKKMIAQIQDPFDAIMDHVVNVRILHQILAWVSKPTETSQAYTIAATPALMEIGVFEAIPMQGSIDLKSLASKCSADLSLISTSFTPLTIQPRY
jgi:hypothetical protein